MGELIKPFNALTLLLVSAILTLPGCGKETDLADEAKQNLSQEADGASEPGPEDENDTFPLSFLKPSEIKQYRDIRIGAGYEFDSRENLQNFLAGKSMYNFAYLEYTPRQFSSEQFGGPKFYFTEDGIFSSFSAGATIHYLKGYWRVELNPNDGKPLLCFSPLQDTGYGKPKPAEPDICMKVLSSGGGMFISFVLAKDSDREKMTSSGLSRLPDGLFVIKK